MSKDFLNINAFGRRFTVKKSNRNMRLSYEYFAKLTNKNKKLMSIGNETSELETKDLGDEEIATNYMESITSVAQSAMELQDVPVEFIKDILKINQKQVSMLDDMTTSETGVLAGQIAHGITFDDDEDSDPKKSVKGKK